MMYKFYDLIDVLYFKHKSSSPRYSILDFIDDTSQNILELPIGTALNSIIIAKNRPKAEITGIDISEEMLQIANEKILKKGLSNIRTIKMDATNLDFKDQTFDVILISLLLHEVDKETRNKIMKEATRVLKNDGKVIIIEWDQPTKLGKRFFFSLVKLLEPAGFHKFLNLNFKEFAKEFSLKFLWEIKCDYSRVIELKKE